MKFCDKLAKLRKSNNLSQEQLAELLGVSRQSISKWESGSTYPDMERMLQLCKILNCKLDEIMDDGVIGNNKTYEQNNNNILKKILNTITNIYNMFCNMKLKEKIKCILELILIIFIVVVFCFLCYIFISNVLYQILTVISYDLGYLFYKVLDLGLKLVIYVFGIIVIYHLFKIRYLDYYINLKNSIEKTLDMDNLKEKNVSNNLLNEKIIIRDSKHSSLAICSMLKKVINILFKIFLIFILFPVILTFILIVFVFTLSIYHINNGLIFVFVAILMLALLLFVYIIVEFIFKYLFNRSQNLKRLFISFIISMVLLGISSGGIFMSSLNLKFIEENSLEELKLYTVTHYYDIKSNSVIDFSNYDVEYVIDDSINNLKVDISYFLDFDYNLYSYDSYVYSKTESKFFDLIDIYILKKDFLNIEFYKLFIKDLSNNIIKKYNNIDYKIVLTLSQKNYNLLKNNKEKYLYLRYAEI